MTLSDFKVGQRYSRSADIHDRFGGQRQHGISTFARHRLIFAFTGTSGRQHGYADEWTTDGVFRYFGEGQKGDMTLTKGNLAIANQKRNGKDILLFGALGDGQVKYCGLFDCVDYVFEKAPDRQGKERRAIVFRLLSRPDAG